MDAADYQQEASKLRKKLAAALGLDKVPHAVWGYVDGELSLPYEAIMGFDGGWEELVSEARNYLEGKRSEATDTSNLFASGRAAGEHVEIVLDEYSNRRAEAFSEVSAALANRRAEVRAFRQERLATGLLTEEQADDFLRGASAEILAHLRSVARTLSKAYRWREKAAEWFVLTGHEPFVKPLNVSVRLDRSADSPNYLDAPYALEGPRFFVETADITIVAEPWVDATQVTKAYRRVQKQVLGGKTGRNTKKDSRTLDAVRFIARQIRDSKPIQWSEITSNWNQAQEDPGRQYLSRGGMSQAFRRFLQPRYNIPRFTFELEPWQEREQAAKEREAERMRNRSKRLGPPKSIQIKKD